MSTTIVPVTGNATDTGRERAENQDYFGFYEDTPYGMLWIVCDGMGGAAGGRTASVMAVDCIRDVFHQEGIETVPDVMRVAVKRANAAVYQRAQEDRSLRGMGTTVAMLVLRDGLFYVGHIGDSRIYRVEDMQIAQITRDHTLVQDMIEQGLISPDKAHNHPKSHVITRSLGVEPEIDIEIDPSPIEIAIGDCFVICSDGLSGLVSPEVIQEHVVTLDPQDACVSLIDLANDNGGPDNITLQVIKVIERDDSKVSNHDVSMGQNRLTLVKKILLLGAVLAAIGLVIGGIWLWRYHNNEEIEVSSANLEIIQELSEAKGGAEEDSTSQTDSSIQKPE
jgi:serine/threonine protein phosphatase PrpC